jgi:hypothetical protein
MSLKKPQVRLTAASSICVWKCKALPKPLPKKFRLNGVDRVRGLERPDFSAYYFTVTATEVVACKEPLVPVTVMA